MASRAITTFESFTKALNLSYCFILSAFFIAIESVYMNPLDLVKLAPLMELTKGKSEIVIGLIDGPVAINHPMLASENIREISGVYDGACSKASSFACIHGTLVAGILSAKRGSSATAICPGCTLQLRPIFKETEAKITQMPSTTPGDLAVAIIETVYSGAKVINLSAAITKPSSYKENRELEDALDYAAKEGVLIVAAAGNQGTIASTTITRHPWVIPVVATDINGKPISQSNLGNSIGKQGLRATGKNIVSLGVDGNLRKFSGTSAAAPFVTGTIALLWSEYPNATATQVKFVVTQAKSSRRTTVVPPLLDAWSAYRNMA